MVDIGNLQLGVQVTGFEAMDRLERQAATLDRQFGQPLVLNVNASQAQQSIDAYVRVTQTGITANRALSESELQLARDMQVAAASRQQVVALERVAANERVQIARTAAQQQTAIERTQIQQAEQNARQRTQIEAQAARTIYQEQQRAAQQQSSGGSGYMSGRGAIAQSVGGGMSGFLIGTAAIAAGGAVTSGLVAATKASIDFNSQLQQSQIAFTTFLGSTEAADAHIHDLAVFAAQTPFQFPDLLEASKRLQAMGFAAQDIIPDLTAVGNAVAALGTGKEGIDRVTLALGQMQQKGKVSGEELRQLAEAGINATQYIANALGKTTAETLALSQKGEISGSVGVAAIVSGISADPKFAGLMEKQSKSFAGSMSNIQDSANMAIAQGLKPLFESLNDGATALAKFTASADFTKGAADFATALHDDIAAVKDFTSTLSDLADNPAFKFLAGMANTYNPARLISGLSEAVTGNQATRNRTDAYVAGGGDIAKLRADSQATIAELQGRNTGLNVIEAAQNSRRLNEARETVRQLDQIAKEHAAEQAQADKFIGPPLPPGYSDQLKKVTDDFNVATSAAEEYRAKLVEIGAAQAQGAGSEDILRGILGITGSGDQATTSQIALAKQNLTDLTAAWKQAGSAVASVDLSRGGISGLAAQSDALHKASTELAKYGQSNSSLNALANVAGIFKQITDAEDKATAAMKGFDLTLSVTKGYMSDISGLKSDFIAALDAAEQRKAAGVADQSDLDLINGAAGSLSKLNDQYGKLQQHSNTDLIGKIASLPDYAALDTYTRNIVDRLGGGKQIVLDVTVGKNTAQKAIDDIVNGHHEATIDLTLALGAGRAVGLPPWVLSALGIAAGGTPASGPSGPPSAGAANPAGWNQYSPLSMGQYSSIVAEGSGGKASPFDSPDMYAAVLSAAQQYGVDPRVLLAFTKAENNNATNISSSLLAANNYGGIKGTGGPMSPEGDTYASFKSPEDFFKALAANLSTGAYAGDYQSGNLYGVAQRYVGSPSPGRVEDYARYASQYPAGAGGAPYDDPRFTKALGGSSGQSIVNAALLDEGAKAFVNQCEKWVEEKVQAATGRRGATGQNEYDANTALANAQKMGLETNNPQPGDLVYYGDAANGHVAIYMGNGQQISTADRGGTAIHQESVGAGAHYVRVPGVNDGVADPRNIDARLTQAAMPDIGAATGPSALDSKSNVFFGRLAQAMTTQAIQPFAAAVRQAFAGMNAQDVSASIGQFNSVLPILDKRAQATGGPGGGATITDAEKIQASNAALQQGLGFLAAWGTALSDIRDKTGNLAADQQKITDLLGGPMAAHLNEQLTIMQSQAAIADRITQLTQRKSDLEASHTALLAQRQAADTAESRAQTRQGWADQAADTALAARTRAENDANTIVMRGFEDRQRALTQYGTLQKQQLQDQLTGLEKANSLAISGFAAQKQILSARAFAGDTSASMQLAIGGDAAKTAADAFTVQKQAINDAITAEDKLASQQQYDLETERLAVSRKHEDILAGIDAEGVANQAERAARDQSHTIDQWQIEDIRAREDANYTLAQTSLDKEIAAQQAMATAADANLKSAQDALTFWQQTGVYVQTATSYLNAAAVSGPNTIRRLDGYASGTSSAASGWAVVGENGPELVRFRGGETVKPVAPATSSGGGGGGDTINITFVASGNKQTDDELFAKLKTYIDSRNGQASGRPVGVMR